MFESKRPKPIVLVVIDGWGVAPPWGGNAISLAKVFFLNKIKREYPNTTLGAAGEAVGLPPGERGNSEVGHLNIGAGQIVREVLPSISLAIKDKSFFTNPVLVKAFDRAKATNKAVHILGLISDGGVHSHIDHLYALLDLAKLRGVNNVCVHAITDGRDSPPFVAQAYLSKVNTRLRELGVGRICTVSGRYYAMDRDHHWSRIEKTYRAIIEGVGPTANSAEAAVAESYRQGFSDEFITPTIIQGENNSYQPLQDGDSLIFFNFRGDRSREITRALTQPNFNHFKRKKEIKDLYFVGFTYYKEGLPIEVAFKPKDINFPLARILSEADLRQLHVAESEKYAHVTYFFNGGREIPFPGEDRIVVPSPHVSSYDQVPAMSSEQITDNVIRNMGRYDFIVLNFASPDMVGHTGNLRAGIQACEVIDAQLERIYNRLQKTKGIMIVTADHGNVEQMVNPKTGEPDTEHTTNPVPFYLIGESVKSFQLRSAGLLSDVAPTILDILGLTKPEEMTGQSLLVKQDGNPSVITARTPVTASTVAVVPIAPAQPTN